MSEALKRSLSTDNERKYQLISRATIRLFAESRGHPISDEVLRVLSEDVNYRLRELVSESAQYMKHSPARTCLTVDDVQQALTDANVSMCSEPSFPKEDPLQYIRIPSIKISVPKDGATDLEAIAASETPAAAVAALTCESGVLEPTHILQQSDKETAKCISKYFSAITEAVVSSDSSLRKVALLDIIMNPKIGHVHHQLLGFIQHWVSAGVKSHKQVFSALEVLDALTNNSYVHFVSQSQLDIITDTLVTNVCLNSWQDDSSGQMADQVYASNILCKCLRHDARLCHQTRLSVISSCEEMIRNGYTAAASRKLIIGALLIITTLDPTALLHVEAEISNILLHDEASSLCDRLIIYSILLEGVDMLFDVSNGITSQSEKRDVLKYCNHIYTQRPDQAICRIHRYPHFTIDKTLLWKNRRHLRKVIPGRSRNKDTTDKDTTESLSQWFSYYRPISSCARKIKLRFGTLVSTRNDKFKPVTGQGTVTSKVSHKKFQPISVLWQTLVHSRIAKLQSHSLYSVQSALSVIL